MTPALKAQNVADLRIGANEKQVLDCLKERTNYEKIWNEG
jgi:hypothetical protein